MIFKKQKLNKRQEIILTYILQGVKFCVSDIVDYFKKSNFQKVSRITIVRDLGFLVKEGFLIRQGSGRATRYLIAPQYNLIKEIDVEKYFSVSQDKRKIKKYFNFSIFDILKNSVFALEEKELLQHLHQEFQRNLKNIKSKAIVAKELERIVVEFSWKSSQIEGNTYSLLDTESLIKEHKAAKGKTKEETQMILNHKKAFDFVLNNKNKFKKLSRAKIEQVHRLLTANLEITKNLRKNPVGITGTNYKPIDNIFQIEEAIEKMVKLINNKRNFFEKAFLTLILLSYIQPFEDGNKRTSRLVSIAVLLSYESGIISYRSVEEKEYKKASLLFYEVNNLWYFKQIFIQQFEFAVKNYF
ncbi:MAG: Fic family protein [Patescibacteria group bacterium]|nr:Fic family protein [Patescibacteria group bacterium]